MLVSYRPLATPKRAGALEAAPGRVDTLARYDRVRDAARARLAPRKVIPGSRQELLTRLFSTLATGPKRFFKEPFGVGAPRT